MTASLNVLTGEAPCPAFGGRPYCRAHITHIMGKNPLDEHQVGELLDVVSGMSREYELIARLGLHTGLRASEMAHMQSSWCDWHNDQIHVPRQQNCALGSAGRPCSDCRVKAGRSDDLTVDDYWRTKTDAGERAIPIGENPDTRRIVRDWFKRHENVGLSRQTIWSRVKDLTDEVSFDRDFGPHHLRHTFGTTIAYNTEDPFYIKQVMGHADISSSQEYVEYTGSQLNEKAEGSLG